MKGKSPPEGLKRSLINYGQFALSIRTVYKCFQRFQSGYMNTSDADRSRYPVEAITPEIIEEIRDMILNDRRMKMREIASAAGISIEQVQYFASTFGHEKVIRKISVAIAYC